jgi:hypothetical protein
MLEKLHNDGLHALSFFTSVIRMIKSRRMRWAGHVAHMGDMRMRIKFWLESLKGRDYSEDRRR